MSQFKCSQPQSQPHKSCMCANGWKRYFIAYNYYYSLYGCMVWMTNHENTMQFKRSPPTPRIELPVSSNYIYVWKISFYPYSMYGNTLHLQRIGNTFCSSPLLNIDIRQIRSHWFVRYIRILNVCKLQIANYNSSVSVFDLHWTFSLASFFFLNSAAGICYIYSKLEIEHTPNQH